MVKDTGHFEHLSDYTTRMYAALGAALDIWGLVEAQLCSIFCAAIQAKKYDVGSAAFSAIISFEVQIAITNAAIREAFDEKSTEISAWKTVYKELDKQRVIRNRLAHGRTLVVRSKVDRKLHERRFLPFFHLYTHKDWRTFERFKIEDIEKMQKGLQALVRSMNDFGKSIGAKQELRSTLHED